MGKKFKTIEKLDGRIFNLTMSDFIEIYLNNGTYTESDRDITKKLTHKAFRSFNNPYVVSISFDYADSNPELIWNGLLLLVTDCKGNLGCYLNPDELRRATEYDDVKDSLKKLRFKNFGEVRLYLELINSINSVVNILKDNHKSYCLKLAKEAVDIENELYENGIFKNSVLQYRR